MAKKSDIITISEGRSGAYFIQAFTCIATAFPAILIWSAFYHKYDPKTRTYSLVDLSTAGWLLLAAILVLLYLGFVFIYSGTVVQFNKVTHQWRSYANFLNVRFGTWVPLPDFIQEIHLNKEYELNPNHSARSSRKTDVNYISYKVSCVHTGNQEVLLYEFSKYKPAYLFLEVLGDYCQLPVWDQVEEQREMAYKRRSQRRRK